MTPCLPTRDQGAKRIFIKDIIYYLFPPNGAPSNLAPSLVDGAKGLSEENNPTVIPLDILRRFQFTFLIRHPRRSIPSYVRCTVPPLDDVTGWYHWDTAEAGYDELRRFFDFCLKEKLVDPSDLVVIDADDLLDDPESVLRAYCDRVGLDFCESMLNWSDEDGEFAKHKFAKWLGWHDDALKSKNLRARSPAHVSQPALLLPSLEESSPPFVMRRDGLSNKSLTPPLKKTLTRESEDREWTEKFGEERAKAIRKAVDDNVADYEYLKKFVVRA